MMQLQYLFTWNLSSIYDKKKIETSINETFYKVFYFFLWKTKQKQKHSKFNILPLSLWKESIWKVEMISIVRFTFVHRYSSLKENFFLDTKKTYASIHWLPYFIEKGTVQIIDFDSVVIVKFLLNVLVLYKIASYGTKNKIVFLSMRILIKINNDQPLVIWVFAQVFHLI